LAQSIAVAAGSKASAPPLRLADKQRELTTPKQFSEVAVEADEVFATLRDGCDPPCVGELVATELLVQTERAKTLATATPVA
jgi:hypothetical protein